MPDGWKHDNGLDPFTNDALADEDGDGCTNLSEFVSGTNPDDPGSKANCHPIADAGPDRNHETGMDVILDGTDSFDPDGSMITFSWFVTGVPGGSAVTADSLYDPFSAKPWFTADVDGDYIFRLTVNDGALESFADEVVITASVPNVAPNAEAGHDKNVLTGSMVNLYGINCYDPDNGPQPLSYLWSFNTLPPASILSDSDIVNGNQETAGFTPDVEGLYALRLTVYDGDFASEDTVEIQAYAENTPPNAYAGDDFTIRPDESAVLDGSASSDPDSLPGALTYEWGFVAVPDGSGMDNTDIFDFTTAYPSFTPDMTGTYVCWLMVGDGQYFDFDNVAVTVESFKGDINGDNVTDITDVILVLRIALGLDTPY